MIELERLGPIDRTPGIPGPTITNYHECRLDQVRKVLQKELFPTKGRFYGPFWMNFRKTPKRPLTPPPPPTLFSENYVALFATTFFGVQRPHPFSLPKKRNEIFRIGNDPPPFGSFPKIHQIWYSNTSLRRPGCTELQVSGRVMVTQ